MVDVNASITQSVSKSASITQSVTRAVSIDETIVSPYADIDATNPVFFAPLKYASTGTDGQVLFQDASATTPVTSPGHPVGAVKRFGSVIATQSVSASRPIWQGESRGVAFNGSDQYLEATAAASTYNFLHQSAATVCVSAAASTLTGDHAFATTFGGTDAGFIFRFDDNSGSRRLRLITAKNSGSNINETSTAPIPSDTNEHIYTVLYDQTQLEFRVDGTSDTSALFSKTPDPDDADTVLQIGRNGNGTEYYAGDMKALVIHASILTGSTLSSLESTMAGL